MNNIGCFRKTGSICMSTHHNRASQDGVLAVQGDRVGDQIDGGLAFLVDANVPEISSVTVSGV